MCGGSWVRASNRNGDEPTRAPYPESSGERRFSHQNRGRPGGRPADGASAPPSNTPAAAVRHLYTNGSRARPPCAGVLGSGLRTVTGTSQRGRHTRRVRENADFLTKIEADQGVGPRTGASAPPSNTPAAAVRHLYTNGSRARPPCAGVLGSGLRTVTGTSQRGRHTRRVRENADFLTKIEADQGVGPRTGASAPPSNTPAAAVRHLYTNGSGTRPPCAGVLGSGLRTVTGTSQRGRHTRRVRENADFLTKIEADQGVGPRTGASAPPSNTPAAAVRNLYTNGSRARPPCAGVLGSGLRTVTGTSQRGRHTRRVRENADFLTKIGADQGVGPRTGASAPPSNTPAAAVRNLYTNGSRARPPCAGVLGSGLRTVTGTSQRGRHTRRVRENADFLTKIEADQGVGPRTGASAPPSNTPAAAVRHLYTNGSRARPPCAGVLGSGLRTVTGTSQRGRHTRRVRENADFLTKIEADQGVGPRTGASAPPSNTPAAAVRHLYTNGSRARPPCAGVLGSGLRTVTGTSQRGRHTRRVRENADFLTKIEADQGVGPRTGASAPPSNTPAAAVRHLYTNGSRARPPCAGVLGTTIHRMPGLRTVTGTSQRIGTTI